MTARHSKLATAQLDRACGALLAGAAGDALGAPFEFGPPLGPDVEVAMVGGGSLGWGPGEWTDDTSMAVAIAEVAADGEDLSDSTAQSRIVARWAGWAREAKDVGNQTRAVLAAAERSAARDGGEVTAGHACAASRAHHDRQGRSGGNGSLMRTGPVALAYIDDELGLVDAARAISALTHHDPEAADACVLWCLAIRHAILTGTLDARVGLPHIDPARRDRWASRIDDAEAARPADFRRNGWVVEAFQAAWSAIATTPVPADDPPAGQFRCDHLRHSIEAAVRGGRDADTVAAIAGSLVGAAYGASAVPAEWRRGLHGWPGLRSRDLVALATATVRGGAPDHVDYPRSSFPAMDALARHPYDDGVWLGGVDALRSLPAGVDAVVSLCRVGEVPVGVEQIDVRLIDSDLPEDNRNLGAVLHDTVVLIEKLRGEGRTVLVHCVQAQSRTPTVAALYGMRRRGASAEVALADIKEVLPDSRPNPAFRAALRATERGNA
jgi:ADP-ribosylglycohydrolase/protein-tyrosine phosphatase